MRVRFLAAFLMAGAMATLAADEGMWRIDQLPLDLIAERYGVKLTPADLERLQYAPVRILSGGGGGTGTFASVNGLILTNHHVALDCIRTSTLAEQSAGRADNLIEQGFTAASMAEELPCKRFRVQIERSARDVTAELESAVRPGMGIVEVQQARQAKRSEIERACKDEKGDAFSCTVVDFNSGASSALIAYEDFKDVRLVYAPEKQLGYFGGDEMNFRFPRYAADISILRAYVGADGSRGEFAASHVPYRPGHFLRITLDGVKDGDFTLVAGNPGNTNRYRMSFSAVYNLEKGIPARIRDYESELTLLRKYAAMKPEYAVLLQDRIFSLANALKYEQDVLAALQTTDVVAERRRREADLLAFLEANPVLAAEHGGAVEAQRAVYADDVEANEDLDSALGWLQRSSTVGFATALDEFARERGKPTDAEREPQFQERFWPDLRESLLDDDPVIRELEKDVLAVAFEKARALSADLRIAAVDRLAASLGAEPTARAMAEAIVDRSSVLDLAVRTALVSATEAEFDRSADAAIRFARDLVPALQAQRQRVRVLNEKLFQNRARFAQALAAWRGQQMYPDANFTLRVTYGKVAGYQDRRGRPVPFTTRLGAMFELAESRGLKGEYALPARFLDWRTRLGARRFQAEYAPLPVNFVTTNDITGGNSGSATLNRKLEIVGLIFDGNEEAMAGDWTYSEVAGRALSTDIRFALTVARDVHGAGWIVDELLSPDRPRPTAGPGR